MAFHLTRKRIDRLILLGAGALAVLTVLFVAFQKTPDTDYYLPAACADRWIVIRYEQAGCAAPAQAAAPRRLEVPEICSLCLPEKLRIGWNRKRFFLRDAGGLRLLPNTLADSSGYLRYIHDHEMRHLSHEALLASLPSGIDTTLFDGARLRKKDRYHVTYTPGRKTIEYFFLSASPQPLDFRPPGDPPVEALESTKDRAIPLNP